MSDSGLYTVQLNSNTQSGTTFIQLLVVLVISAIISGLALPAYANLLTSQQRSAAMNAFQHTLFSAKFEANKTLENIVICPSQDAHSCQPGSYDYSYGWIMFINRDKDYPVKRDLNEELLYATQFDLSKFELVANRQAFTFKPLPKRSTNGTLMFCPQEKFIKTHNYQALIISYTGRPRLSKQITQTHKNICD
ncbi:MAG: hypothetical protein HKN88_06275 [Gammaproteobacteria bacterium]|nr:GspH/FimT family pseudopilin [Gammaproteobacteria bacterium]NNC97662.1 hypothetical protein [Gammaproteobacteria bacterium]NNM12838.1 hypothetical protein [Gammaproteobacteria bacterium]